MRASFVTACASAVVVLFSALAESRTHATIRPASLARYEAITSYCVKADPVSADQYAAKLASLTGRLSIDELTSDRNSARYRDAFAEANETLSKASSATGVKGCTEFLAEK